MKLIIDSLLCEAHGICTRLVPEALVLGDDEVLRPRLETIPAELEERVRKAVQRCPRQALRIEPA